jgi:UDP-GlcNAc3NAcA epimerase
VKVLTVVGARPQFIKASVVSHALGARDGITEILVHTGQHYDPGMSEVFFRELGIPKPAYNLQVGSASHGAQTGRMLEELETVIRSESPDWVLVYGDTNSTLAGALAASKLHVPVAHVEAGLRSFNRRMPEEVNRVVTDHLSDLLLTPTEGADQNLATEGIGSNRVVRVGDVMFDASLHFGRKAERESDVLARLSLAGRDFVVATVHRAENTDDPLRLGAITAALQELGDSLPVVLPLHPRTEGAMRAAGLQWPAGGGVKVIPPVGYLDMLMLQRAAVLVVTDSGGMQKEAYFCGTPCVTLRSETEWTELVELGWNRLAPPLSVEALREALGAMLSAGPGRTGRPYGTGDAAAQTVRILEDRCGPGALR